jgi:triacylglycerol lipase
MSFLVELPLAAYRADVFDHFTPGSDFHIGTARALMWMAQLAYEVRDAPQKVEPTLRQWDFEPVDLLAHANPGLVPIASTRGFVARGHGAIVVAFAGTDPLALGNWITNFMLGSRAREAHFGFEAAVHAIWDDLACALRQNAGVPFFITGHSLGGALAVIAAERIGRELKITPAGVYTYGAPRAGTAAFCSLYEAAGLTERTFRLVHGHDVIPTIPPSGLGFRHVGRMLACPRAGSFAPNGLSACDCDDPPFVDTLKNGYRQRWRDIVTRSFPASSRSGVLGWYQRYVLPPLIGDHLPDRYRGALDKASQN